jgi:hypothetical protein
MRALVTAVTIWGASYAVLWLLVIGMGALVVALLRHIGGLELRIEALSRTSGQTRVSRIDRNGLPPGSAVPEMTLLTADGREATFAPTRGRRAVVVLSQPGCGPCERLLPELGRLAVKAGAPDVVVITKGAPGSYAGPAGVRVLYQRGAEAMAKLRAFATPWVFVIGPDGIVRAQGIASDGPGLRRLLAAPAPPAPDHTPVPHTLPTPQPTAKELCTNGTVGAVAE